MFDRTATNDSRHAIRALALSGLLLVSPLLHGVERFVRADSNADGAHDIGDPVNTLNVLFLGVGEIPCGDAADVNDDGELNVSDSVSSLAFLFSGGRPPAAPYPRCGPDPTIDSLGCLDYPESSCPPVPNLARVAGHCGGVPDSAYPNSLKPGDELHKVTLDGPVALCNDGSPAVFYVRAASPESVHFDDWVIYLQGGGGCQDWETCRERWCGMQSRQYDESKMSSRYTPESIGGEGIFAVDDSRNVFADWNHVYVYYCSSDSWSGQRETVLRSPDDSGEDFSIHFRGHDIVKAVARSLFDGARSDDGEVELPPLGEGRMVLFTGASAGAGGVLNNGDWFASLFDPDRTLVRLVRDASLGFDYSLHPDSVVAENLTRNHDAIVKQQWDEVMSEDVRDAFVDESCHAYSEANGEAWRCADSSYVARNHITTPFFQRGDLRDPGPLDTFIAIGGDPAEYSQLRRLTLDSLQHVPATAVESSSISRRPGAFGPMCGQHISLANVSFLRDSVLDAGGTRWTFHDALVAWLRGTDVAVIDNPAASSSICGPLVSNDGE